VSAALIVIAKEPAPGRAKTRLCPPLTADAAAGLAAASLADTLAAVAACRAPGRRVLALDGAPGKWVPPGFEVIAQRGRGLDERLASAFEDVAEPALLIGMDTPQVTPALLSAGVRMLSRPGTDAVLGPALDGGYWAVGLRRPRRDLFVGVPMSSPVTFEAQLARLRGAGLQMRSLPPLRDVDLIEDARAVAGLAPGSRFAEAFGSLAA
jgi:rSAM/selenodomain-associated transferase 1